MEARAFTSRQSCRQTSIGTVWRNTKASEIILRLRCSCSDRGTPRICCSAPTLAKRPRPQLAASAGNDGKAIYQRLPALIDLADMSDYFCIYRAAPGPDLHASGSPVQGHFSILPAVQKRWHLRPEKPQIDRQGQCWIQGSKRPSSDRSVLACAVMRRATGLVCHYCAHAAA